jgi:uncharacterized protein YecE (DUF72 family)
LRRSNGAVWRAWETTLGIAHALEAAVVFLCPASFRPTQQNVRNLETFFRRVGACRHLLAWEPRGDWPNDTELRELPAKVVADGTREAYLMFNNVWMKDDAARFLAMILAMIECPRSAF